MGGSVSSFFSNVAKTVVKGAISGVGGVIPIVGPALANHINSKFLHGGKVHKFALGGTLKNLPPNVKTRAINSVEGLRALIRQYPNEARLAGLSLEDTYRESRGSSVGREEAQHASYEGEGAGRKEAQEIEERKFAHGGKVISLPVSNLDRLDRFAHGGLHLAEGDGEQSFVMLRHGHRAGHAHHHLSKKFCV